jgi:hypothetical protein
MIASIFLGISLLALALWLYRKYAMRRDHMGKKDDEAFFSRDTISSFYTGDEHSFRRRM